MWLEYLLLYSLIFSFCVSKGVLLNFACRKDAGARSGNLSDNNALAIVPHTETSSSGEDNAVVPRDQQSQGTHAVSL